MPVLIAELGVVAAARPGQRFGDRPVFVAEGERLVGGTTRGGPGPKLNLGKIVGGWETWNHHVLNAPGVGQFAAGQRTVLRNGGEQIADARLVQQGRRKHMIRSERDHVVLKAGQVSAVGAAAVLHRNVACVWICGGSVALFRIVGEVDAVLR